MSMLTDEEGVDGEGEALGEDTERRVFHYSISVKSRHLKALE